MKKIFDYCKLKAPWVLSVFALLFSVSAAYGQSSITGTVKEAGSDEPLVGATVIVKGKNVGTTTDLDGNYEVNASENDTLRFSYVGYVAQEVPVAGRSVINIALATEAEALDEVVVVGYGTQRSKDLTSAIVTVDNEEISKTPTPQAMQALQGKVAGVQIVSSGAPGSGPTVRIRGIGSLPGFGNSDPLYVVDGMFFEDIDFLNPSDIASISVLKDASAAAIYGVRAANGVVLIETTSGNYNQKTKIEYNGYYGQQRAQNVLEMSDTELFAQYVQETGDPADQSFIDNSIQRYGADPDNPSLPAVNTDWYEEVLRPGPIQNHSLNISGGTNNVKYSVGANYFAQEGLLKVIPNDYTRTNFRAKVQFKATDRLDIGGNVILSNATRHEAPDGVWFQSYFAVPVLPVYEEQDILASPEPIASAQTLGYRGTQNPFFTLHYNNDRQRIGDILGNFSAEYDIIPEKLTIKTAYNYNYGTRNERFVDFAFNDGQVQNQNALTRRSVTTFNQIWDNILTYKNSFGSHNLTVMGGYSFRSEQQEGTFARATEVQGLERGSEELWFISDSGGDPNGLIDEDGTGDIGGREFGVSYLSRVAYNYRHKYLLYGTYRRDGTNKFQATWGNFFTFGAGWVVSEEPFFNLGFVDYLKFRGSWGELGNDAINPAVGQATREAIFTAIDENRVQGLTIDNAFDLVTRWETVVETNVGLTGNFFNSRLSMEAEYYQRDTRDAVTLLLVPGQRSIIRRSLASVRNSGFELQLGWSDNLSENVSFTIGGNFATLNNEVLDLGPGPGYLNAGSAEFRQRSIEGQAVNSYFGYEVEGIFQSVEQIDASGYDEEFIANQNIEPGDFFFKDQNGDGFIDADDRVVLGSFLPNLTFGGYLTVGYKNFDLSVNIQGQTGHQILNRKRGEIIFTTDPNIDAELASNLWRGNGTSNKYPSAAGLRKGYNQQMSEYYIEDGTYFRVQNVRLGYDFSSLNARRGWPNIRLFLTAERPLTVFDYNGFNPEVPNGVDRQTYPIPAIYTIGGNIQF